MSYAILMLMIMMIDNDIDDYDDDLCNACRSQCSLFQAFVMREKDKHSNVNIIVMVLRRRKAMVVMMMIIVMITIYT